MKSNCLFRYFSMQKSLDKMIETWTKRIDIRDNAIKGINESNFIFIKGPAGAGKSELVQDLFLQEKLEYFNWFDFSRCYYVDCFEYLTNELKSPAFLFSNLTKNLQMQSITIKAGIVDTVLTPVDIERNTKTLRIAEKDVIKKAVTAKMAGKPYFMVFDHIEWIKNSQINLLFK